MTTEQAKQLKTGDKILVEAEIRGVCRDGDIEFKYPYRDGDGGITWSADHVIPERVSLMPKYDPRRLFKKGDKVRLVEWNGRTPVFFGMNFFQMGEILEVEEDEKSINEGLILVSNAENKQGIHSCHLELVHPVEELQKYYVRKAPDKGIGWWDVCSRDSSLVSTVISTFSSSHPCAKQAAEAECARLNAEYRKEQNND